MTLSFLQTPDWAEFQQKLGRTVIVNSGDGWSYQAIHESGTLNTRLYAPYGPVAATEAAMIQALEALESSGRSSNATFVRIEPQAYATPALLTSRGYKRVRYNQLQPEHTRLIDLLSSEGDIIAAMNQNNRNIYRNFHNKAVTIHTSVDPADIDIFLGFAHSVAKRNHITPHSDEYFRTQATVLFPTGAAKLLYATYEDTPIAAAIMYDTDDTRTYAHAAADDAYRKLSAGTALLAYAIVDAKRAGKQHFDLYGIAPTDDPSHPWAGFTKFKKSFGGRSVDYVGAWDLPLQPLRYRLYRLYQSIRRLIRH
ncbi:MAG: peptidoglycan bridge formation glycyltransferase FemA/FemB family protein [Candidatus Saccharimonadales bacterium]